MLSDDEIRQTFAKRLKEFREAAELSQAELGEKLGVSRGSISFYENCDRIPDIVFLGRAATFFEVSPQYLLGLSEAKSPKADVQAVCAFTGLSEKAVLLLHRLMDCKICRVEYASDSPSYSGFPLTDSLSKIIVQKDVFMALSRLSHVELIRGDLRGENVRTKDYFDSEEAYYRAIYAVRGTGISLLPPDEKWRFDLFEAKQHFSNAIDKAFGLEHQNSSPETE